MEHDLYIASTSGKRGHKWTWQHPLGYHYILDFLIIRRNMLPGPRETYTDEHNNLPLRREGAHIDHLPVVMKLQLPYKWKAKPNPPKALWDTRQLTKVAAAWEQHRVNQQCKHPKAVNPSHLDTARRRRLH